MKLIGLTGGIATGKTEVTKIIRKLNIPVFDADASVHEIYENGIGARHLKTLCPDAVEGNKVDRKKLSKLIVDQPALMKQIELIIHPLVRQAEVEFLSQARQANYSCAVIDSPLLIETGHYKDMDVTILIDASIEIQKHRAMMRSEMTEEKFKLMIAKQMSSAEKRKHSNYIIENNGSLAELESQTQKIFERII